MCRLNNCCCCCSLETGGFIIGWLNIIISGLAMIGLISLLSLLIAGHNSDAVTIEIDDNIVGGYATLITVYVILILYYFIVFVASVMLVQGIRKRDHSRMMLFMILMAVGVALQFIQVLIGGWSTLISGLFFALLSLYFFSVIYSLYHNIKEGGLGRPYA